MVRILLADDHQLVRAGLKGVIAEHKDWSVCGEAVNGAEAVSKAFELQPDVIILDIWMPVMNGIEAAAQIRKLAPATKIIVVSTHDRAVLSKIAQIDADAYLSKSESSEKLVETLRAVVSGLAKGPAATT